MEPGAVNVSALKMSKEQKKLIRKQVKASHVLLKHEGIATAAHPTKHLVVANGGLGNGVSREQLCAAVEQMGELETVLMPPHKPYAFVTYRSEESAKKAHAVFNGQPLDCGENRVTLYLSFVDSVACEAEKCVSLPEGLVLVEDVVSPEEEAALLDAVDWSSTSDEVAAQKALKHRRVKHYGYEFRYDTNNVDKDKPLSAGLPEECMPVLERCLKAGHIDTMPDQLTVNQYHSGQGIPPHVDTHSAFEDAIVSLSLGAKTVMEFRHPDGRVVAVVLPGRSLLVMKGASRYHWTHGITPRKFDVVPACDTQPAAISSDLTNHGNLTLSKRGTRTSFTFRRIRHTPCQCAFPSACDSQGTPSAPSPASPPLLPRCHADAARLEETYVHRVYDAIASHFSSTRHSPWPRVCRFLSSLPPGSVLADVGCGNGKYLGVNPDTVSLGCDRSSALVQICTERGFQAFVSDALAVPLRPSTCDACISIAVIHHFSSQERRLAAVRELVRLLKPGGRALIYVWALEQEYKQQRSKYLKDSGAEPFGSPPDSGESPGGNIRKGLEDDGEKNAGNGAPVNQAAGDDRVHPGKLSVHTNRTAFNSQDLLVPWHLKEGKTGGEKARKGGKEAGKGKRKDGSKTSSDNSSTDARLPDTPSPHSNGNPNPNPSLDSNPLPDSQSAPMLMSNSSLGSGGATPSGLAAHISDAGVSGPDTKTPEPSKPSPESRPKPGQAAVFHRYYHVFQQGELERLCGQVAGVQILSSYHDQGNWCVILEKE